MIINNASLYEIYNYLEVIETSNEESEEALLKIKSILESSQDLQEDESPPVKNANRKLDWEFVSILVKIEEMTKDTTFSRYEKLYCQCRKLMEKIHKKGLIDEITKE